MTEDEFVSETGQVSGTGTVDPVAQRWADNLTENYNQLAKADPVFGQLRNLMDLSVVAALLAREDLAGMAGCDLACCTTRMVSNGTMAGTKVRGHPKQFSEEGPQFRRYRLRRRANRLVVPRVTTGGRAERRQDCRAGGTCCYRRLAVVVSTGPTAARK